LYEHLVCVYCAADGFKHWTITENGGDEFMVQPDKCPGCEHVSSIGIAGELCLLDLYHFVVLIFKFSHAF